jgi:glycosyltransferase involved in cell wall biosynthesis
MDYDTGGLISRALKAKIPFVFVNHFDNGRLSHPQTRKWITQAAGIATISNRNIPDEFLGRTVNVSNAVDTEFFAPERAQPIDLAARHIVLLAARIAAGKGHADLMEAARIMVARNVDLTLCFVGAVDSEPLHQELRRFAAATGLEKRVLFLGESRKEEIRDWYALSSVVVLPSHSEGLGRVLLEAQAMKRPVVAYDCGGVSEAILPNETGFLVKTGNVGALADKISYVLENETERQHMGERGREFVTRQFSVSALIRRHEAFYCRVLSGGRAKVKSALIMCSSESDGASQTDVLK